MFIYYSFLVSSHMNYKSCRVQMMQYCDEVLAQSARNYAFTSDNKWVKRYVKMEKKLDKLLRNEIKKADPINKDFFPTIYSSNQKLVEMEYHAIDLVHELKSKKAIEFLDGKTYAQQRTIMVRGLEKFIKKLIEKESRLSMISEPVNEIIALEQRLAVLEKQLKEEKFTTVGRFASNMYKTIDNFFTYWIFS